MNKSAKNIYSVGLCILFFGISQPIEAEFALNFTPALSTSVMDTSGTPFLMAKPLSNGLQFNETVNDPTTGLNYYHMIVGSVADGFIQESYVQTGSIAAPMLFCGGNTCNTSLNNQDPIGITGSYVTGNAQSTPTKTIVRQFMSDGEIMSEFLKDKYDNKPLITQMITAPDATAFFQTDMRNSTYSDMNTPGTMINTFSLPGSGYGDFDMSQDAQSIYVTAGRFTYTNGTGPGGSAGTYNYFAGSATFDPDWSIYMDELDPRNIWSYPTNHP